MMMTPERLLDTAIGPAHRVLPMRMLSDEAEAMLIAIALQESGLRARVQSGGGPAHGLWQFERGGIAGVLQHHTTGTDAQRVCRELLYDASVEVVYQALPNADVLAAVFARLYLWQWPGPLPSLDDPWEAWEQYVGTWRPGKPHRHRWAENWAIAVNAVRTEDDAE